MSVDQIPNPPEDQVLAEEVATDEADPAGETDPAGEPESPQENSVLDNVRQLLPTHLLPKTKTGRPIGRPRKINPAPTSNDLNYHAEMAEARQRFIAEDPVVKTLSGKPDSANLLSSLRMEIAKEAAALHFQRIESEKHGKDTAQTSTRRIDALTRIAHIELEIKKLAPDTLDVRSEKFQKVFSMFIEMMRESAKETLAPEAIDMFFNRFGSRLDGWEDKAENLIR
jgi:hypothetical protein